SRSSAVTARRAPSVQSAHLTPLSSELVASTAAVHQGRSYGAACGLRLRACLGLNPPALWCLPVGLAVLRESRAPRSLPLRALRPSRCPARMLCPFSPAYAQACCQSPAIAP